MTTLFWKLKVLCWQMQQAFAAWQHEIWARHPDDQFCCNGDECGCQGITYREVYDPPATKVDYQQRKQSK